MVHRIKIFSEFNKIIKNIECQFVNTDHTPHTLYHNTMAAK
jgi:hypothetical protein